jgi:ferrous iron transport protein B
MSPSGAQSIRAEASPADPAPGEPLRIALVGNPNTGKTTLFNRLCGLRHKTSNFPGTTQDARIGMLDADGGEIHLIDLPGVYSLEIDQPESALCRGVLDGVVMPQGERAGSPDAVCVVMDATNLARNLVLAGEVLRRRLPTVVALNMIDLARRAGQKIDYAVLGDRLGCRVVPVCARTGEGFEGLRAALGSATIPNRTPPGSFEALERWADEAFADAASVAQESFAPGTSGTQASRGPLPRSAAAERTDRIDRVLVHPLWGSVAFLGVMTALFFVIFKLATYPMGWIEAIFVHLGNGVRAVVPAGLVQDLLADGVVAGISGVVVFLPQICLLFFLISILEDTGYLARAALLMDRLLRPFGLPGHAFVPLLSSHACALPGIMSARAIPDRRERLAAILVAPFMSCSARVPVYVLLTTILFPDSPALAALAFISCYALGIIAGLGTSLIFRRTFLRGKSRPMALELPTYKAPSIRTALVTTWDRAWTFLRSAGTNILAICVVLWWLGNFPHVEPPARVAELRALAATADTPGAASAFEAGPVALPATESAPAVEVASAEQATEEADRLETSHAAAHSFMGRLGRTVQPVFAPLGYDWQVTIAVMTSFAAREVFGATMAVIVTGTEDFEDQGVTSQLATAKRSDGRTLVFTPATAWSLLIFYVLAMQCLPTLAVTAREAGGAKWAVLQLVWMSAVAYAAALLVFQALGAAGIS